ncbi:MAG: PKD domain-containing protein, partial [Pricia sp.]
AQDNSGTVTVTPTAEGAYSYDVSFVEVQKDTVIGIGGTATNTYTEEGEYSVKIIATSPNELTTEQTFTFTVLLNAILNFESGLLVSETAREIQLTPTGDNANSFDIDFGDGTSQTLTAGEDVRYTYAEGGDYDITVTANNADTAQTVESTDTVSFATGSLPLVLSFDDILTDYSFGPFGGVTTEIVVNPFLTGENMEESNVAAITNSGTAFEGFTYELPSAIDFSGTDKTILVKVYYDGEDVLPLTLQFVDGLNGERGVEVAAMHTGSGWETLTFDFTNALKVFLPDDPENSEPITADGQYQTLALFIDGPGTTAGTFFLDDFMQIEGEVIVPEGPEYQIDFEDNVLEGSFDFGSPIQIVDNPVSMGINTSSKVLEVLRGADPFQGAGFSIPALDLTTDDKTITVKLYSETAVALSIDLKEGVDGARSAAVMASHTGTGWETLTFDYANATKAFEDGDPENFAPLPADEVGVYTQMVFIVDADATAGVATYYLDDITKGAATTPPPVEAAFEVNFEDDALTSSFDFGSPIQIVDNPVSMGINTSAKVLEVARGADPFQGAGFSIPNLDLTTNDKTITVKLYSETAVPLSIDLKEGLDGARSAAQRVEHTGTGWEVLTFDYANATKAFEDGDPENFAPLPADEVGVYTQIVFIVDPDATAGAGTYYMDDIIKF